MKSAAKLELGSSRLSLLERRLQNKASIHLHPGVVKLALFRDPPFSLTVTISNGQFTALHLSMVSHFTVACEKCKSYMSYTFMYMC